MSKKKKHIDQTRGKLKNQEATEQTLRKAAENPDPLRVMRDNDLFHSGLEDSVMLIKSAIRYLSTQSDYQTSDYTRVFDPSRGTPTDDEHEPAEVKRYTRWSELMVGRYGSSHAGRVRDCIAVGTYCDPRLFVMMVKLF